MPEFDANVLLENVAYIGDGFGDLVEPDLLLSDKSHEMELLFGWNEERGLAIYIVWLRIGCWQHVLYGGEPKAEVLDVLGNGFVQFVE